MAISDLHCCHDRHRYAKAQEFADISVMRNDGVDELTQRIIACAIRVHHTLGPGFLENVYRRALQIELRLEGAEPQPEKEVLIHYRNREVWKAPSGFSG